MADATTLYHASDGAAYERFLGRWTQRLAEPFIAFANPPAATRALDVGCGTGSVALALARRGQAAGIDAARPYVDYARARPGAGAIAFEVGDARRLPYPDGAFGAALAQLVLNFVPDAAGALAEMMRVTAPGGTVAANVWDFRGGLVYQRLFWDTAAGIDPDAAAARDRLFAAPLALPDGLLRLFAEAGLDAVERTSLTIRMDYADFADYWKPLLGGQGPFGSYVASRNEALRQALRERVRAAYLSGAPDGPRSMTATAWAVRGTVR
jgi:SAM-dependent methyltransferase